MSVGKRIVKLRLDLRKTQREVADGAGLAVSYLSRLENEHTTPSIRTLSKISEAMGVPVTAFFDREAAVDKADACPISTTGRCILEHLNILQSHRAKGLKQDYTKQQIEILRMCDFLLHQGDRKVLAALSTLVRALFALAASEKTSAHDVATCEAAG